MWCSKLCWFKLYTPCDLLMVVVLCSLYTYRCHTQSFLFSSFIYYCIVSATLSPGHLQLSLDECIHIKTKNSFVYIFALISQHLICSSCPPASLVLPRLLIQAGYDVNIKDYDGWTPLHAAAHWGKEEACRILVEHLCDMEVVNKVVSGLFFHWKLVVSPCNLRAC